MSKKLYEEESVRAIANAIRNKGVSGSFKISEMPDAIASIKSGGGVVEQPLDVRENGEYVAPEGVAYSPVKVDVSNSSMVTGWHCDSDGKFVYPTEEWGVEYNGVFYDNNIENIEIADSDETLYVLCEANGINDYCRLRIGGGSTYVCYGLVKDGVFTQISTNTTVASGGYYTLWLEEFEFDHFVIRVKQSSTSQHISYLQTSAWVSDGVHTSAMNSASNSVLMRYGNMPYGTTASCVAYSLEVDNVKNFASKKTNSALVISYSGCCSLQKWRNDGWNIVGNYCATLASMFNTCYLLSDVPNPLDLTGWCSSRTTSIGSMFSAAYAMRTKLIVRNWDLSAVTTTASCFSNARSIYAIEGLETWTGGQNITTIGSTFNACWNLRTPIDLSGLTLSNKLVTLSSVFNTCYSIPEITLPDLDLTNVTTVASMFNYCTSLKKINHGTIIPATTKLTSAVSLFAYCNSLHESDFIKDWDLTNANAYNLFSYCTSMTDSRDFYIHTVVPSKLSVASSSSVGAMHYYCTNLKYVDYSMVDLSLDTASTKYLQTYAYNTLYNVVDVEPHKQFLDVAFTVGSQKISRESLVKILNALPVTTKSTKLTIASANLAKLSNDDKAIATGKGWTLA